MDMGAMEMEPRTSMERHLMDRDREGQLYLEARRHQAAQDLLQNRTSFLSTITPPSSNPSSVASSLFREPVSSHNQHPGSPPFNSSSSMPTLLQFGPGLLSSVSSQRRDQTLTGTSTTLSSLAPIQNIPPKKTRHRHRSGSSLKGRSMGVEAPTPLKPISPSSLEYQLTANLLKSLDSKSRARSHSRSHTTKRRGMASSQHRPQHHIITQSTGHRRTNEEEEEFEASNSSSYGCTVAELTPTSLLSSIPSSPINTHPPCLDITISDAMREAAPREPKLVSVPLPPIPPSPPLPPIPPKSPRSLIAHYFPRSLLPPPPRDRTPYGHKEPPVSPTPLKTPTFGPAGMDATEAPPLPSPSASFHYIPSTNHSHPTHIHVECSSSFDSSSPRSPSTSALGFSASFNAPSKPHQDILSLPMRPRSPLPRPSTPNHGGSRPATPPLPLSLTPTSPMYPKGLLPHSPLSDHFQKPAVPYVSELFAKASTSPPSSANTSRDLEMVIAGITGRLGRTNRTSLEPWPYSPWDDKPLPTVRREPGERYWVFRDTDGLVLGPILFILGHLCPVLWWVGAVYPATRHPSDIKRVGIRKKYQASRARLWIRDRWEVKVKGVIKPLFVRGKAHVGSLESVVTLSHEGASVVGGATVGASQVRVPIQGGMEEEGVEEEEEVTTRGPWSADSSDHASSLFEQKMEYDRKVLRYELDLRWRHMNLAWSVGSFVLAIAITAVVIAAST